MKNIIIGVLLVAVLVEGYMVFTDRRNGQAENKQTTGQASVRPTGRPPQPLSKGSSLTGSDLEKYAFEVFPVMSDAAKKAITGFDIKTQKLADGSTQVNFVPKDSDDQSQQYIVKAGNTLYFVEMTVMDDKPDADKDLNYRDDYGIITDANGIVQ